MDAGKVLHRRIGDDNGRLQELGNEVRGLARPPTGSKRDDDRAHRHGGGDHPHDDEQCVVHNQLSEVLGPTLSGDRHGE